MRGKSRERSVVTPKNGCSVNIVGRVAVVYVQGSPKGGGAWAASVSGYYVPA